MEKAFIKTVDKLTCGMKLEDKYYALIRALMSKHLFDILYEHVLKG